MGSSSGKSISPEEVENLSPLYKDNSLGTILSLIRISVFKQDNFMVKGNQASPLKEMVLVDSHVSIGCLLNEKQRTVKDTHALDFFLSVSIITFIQK